MSVEPESNVAGPAAPVTRPAPCGIPGCMATFTKSTAPAPKASFTTS